MAPRILIWSRTSSDETVMDSKVSHIGESSPSINVCPWVNLLTSEQNVLKAFALAVSSVKKHSSDDKIRGMDKFDVLKQDFANLKNEP